MPRRWTASGTLAGLFLTCSVQAEAPPAEAQSSDEQTIPPVKLPQEGPPAVDRIPEPLGASTDGTSRPESAPSNDTQSELNRLREEVKQLRADFETSRVPEETSNNYERLIDFYGFMDMGFQKLWINDHSAMVGLGTSRASTFVLGNVNFYIDANPNQIWRGLTELRITNYPNGALVTPGIPAMGQSEQRINGTINDVNAADSGWNTATWSAFVLEQSWIQATVTDWFGIRVGYWLTPFGIWNIEHGSPTVIGLSRPQFTRGRFYPEHQLGVQAVGHINSQAWKLGYTVYMSNGKTPGSLDMTNDKAFGVRLSAQTARPFPMTFGLAGYTGRFSRQTVNSSPATVFSPSLTETVAYRQWDIGADVSLDVGKLRIRSEFALERVDYDANKHELLFDIPGRLTPNHTLMGWYSIAAYRLPWIGLEPYGSFELYRYPTPLGEAIVVPGIGLNMHINTEAQIKTQFTKTHFFDFSGGKDRSQQDAVMFASRLVLVF